MPRFEPSNIWPSVRRHWVLLAILCVCIILIFRESGIATLDFFERTADGDSSLNCYGSFKREQVDHLAYEDVSTSKYTMGEFGPKAAEGKLLVREYVGCDTPWTSWLPFHKWGKVHVFRVFRLINDKGLADAHGSQEFISNVSVTGICSHRRFIEDTEQFARSHFEGNLRSQIRTP